MNWSENAFKNQGKCNPQSTQPKSSCKTTIKSLFTDAISYWREQGNPSYRYYFDQEKLAQGKLINVFRIFLLRHIINLFLIFWLYLRPYSSSKSYFLDTRKSSNKKNVACRWLKSQLDANWIYREIDFICNRKMSVWNQTERPYREQVHLNYLYPILFHSQRHHFVHIQNHHWNDVDKKIWRGSSFCDVCSSRKKQIKFSQRASTVHILRQILPPTSNEPIDTLPAHQPV